MSLIWSPSNGDGLTLPSPYLMETYGPESIDSPNESDVNLTTDLNQIIAAINYFNSQFFNVGFAPLAYIISGSLLTYSQINTIQLYINGLRSFYGLTTFNFGYNSSALVLTRTHIQQLRTALNGLTSSTIPLDFTQFLFSTEIDNPFGVVTTPLFEETQSIATARIGTYNSPAVTRRRMVTCPLPTLNKQPLTAKYNALIQTGFPSTLSMTINAYLVYESDGVLTKYNTFTRFLGSKLLNSGDFFDFSLDVSLLPLGSTTAKILFIEDNEQNNINLGADKYLSMSIVVAPTMIYTF
jgi:hypothetical protein